MKKKIVVEYASNNSGGIWWLKDKDWYNLEKNGWTIAWENKEFIYKNGDHVRNKNGIPKLKNIDSDNKEKRFLGTLAQYAFKTFNNIEEALKEFKKITKKDMLDEGCKCCGAPHKFTWQDIDGNNYFSASGSELNEFIS